ncbi:MAG: phenylacetate-CoA oxygenase subunit PaaJ [Alphaproteobacteria bacterium]|jgi:ring-1,2-phenylacetyl-CoA epoxidase subunit PaaD|nr:phenylacetate-CoA oxygenase subunit PaaJ [Alphaproteobacteria bacterium]
MARPAAGEVERRVWDALTRVHDPEIPGLDIVEMGVARQVVVGRDGEVEVVITPTYSGCPAMSVIAIDVGRALAEAGFADARVSLTHSPAWTTDWLTPGARAKLAAQGIAPPVGTPGGRRALFGEGPVVACPQCGSRDTERLAEFGSTACKAMYRCRSCAEPFHYFKCV